MNTVATKEMRKEVKKFVDEADDKTVKMLYALMEAERENDWWDDLPVDVKKEIDKAITDLDKWKGTSHEQVMKKYSKWFTR